MRWSDLCVVRAGCCLRHNNVPTCANAVGRTWRARTRTRFDPWCPRGCRPSPPSWEEASRLHHWGRRSPSPAWSTCIARVHGERGAGQERTSPALRSRRTRLKKNLGRLMWQYLCRMHFFFTSVRVTVYVSHIIHSYIMQEMQLWLVFYMLQSIHHW